MVDKLLGTPLQQLKLRQDRISPFRRGPQGSAFEAGLGRFAAFTGRPVKSSATRSSFKSFLKEAEEITGQKLLTGAGKATDFVGTLQSGFFKEIERSGASSVLEGFRAEARQQAGAGALNMLRSSLQNLGPEGRELARSLTNPELSTLLGSGASVRRLQKDSSFRKGVASQILKKATGAPKAVQKAFEPAQPGGLQSSVKDEVKRLTGIQSRVSKFAIKPVSTVGASLIKPTLKGE